LLVEVRRAVEIRCYGEFFRCSVGSGGFDQRLEPASILAAGGAPKAARLTKSAVFAAVASKSGPLAFVATLGLSAAARSST